MNSCSMQKSLFIVVQELNHVVLFLRIVLGSVELRIRYALNDIPFSCGMTFPLQKFQIANQVLMVDASKQRISRFNLWLLCPTKEVPVSFDMLMFLSNYGIENR